MADGRLIFDTKIDNTGFQQGMSKLKSIGTTAMKTVAKGVAATSAALIAAGGYALKTSIDFESAFAGVRKTIDATEAEFAMLKEGIRALAKRMPQSATAIAGVAEAAGQLGIQTENVLGFTETMVMLGDATNLSSEEAATALARLANITGMSQNDFDRLGSTIVELGNNLATTEAEIVTMGLRLAGTATQVGLTEHEILALAGAMSSVGINAEAGGSSMSRVMQKINTEVISGGKNLSKFAEIAGMSADEFSRTWETRPTEAILAFIKGLDEVNASGGDVSTMLKELGINSIQELDTLLRLAGASDVLADALEMSAEAWEENTALADEASQRYETTASMMQILKNNVDDLAISIGDELKESFISGIGTAIEMVQQLADAFEQGGIEGFVEEIGTVLADVTVKIAEYAPILLENASNLITSFIQGIRDNQEFIGLAAVDLIQSFIMTMLETIPEALVLGIELITTFLQGMAEAIPELIPVAMDAINTILEALVQNLPLMLDAGIKIVASLLEGFAGSLPDIITAGIDLLIGLADAIIENIDLVIKAGLQIVVGLVKGIMNNLPKLIENVPRIINDFAAAIYKNLPEILKAGVKIILELIKGLLKSIPTLIVNIPQIILAIVNAFTLYNWAQMGMNLMTWVGNGIKSLAGNLGSIGKSVAQGVWNAISGIFKGGPSLGSGFVSHIGNGIKTMFGSLRSIGTSLARGALDAIKNAFNAAPSIGRSMVQGIWNGISDVTGWILNQISGFGRSVMNRIKGIFGIQSPSKWMRDEIGKNLILGMGVGIEKEVPKLQRDLDKEMRKLAAQIKSTVDLETRNNARVMAGGGGYSRGSEVITNNNDNGVTQNVTIVSPQRTPSENARELRKVGRDLALGY